MTMSERALLLKAMYSYRHFQELADTGNIMLSADAAELWQHIKHLYESCKTINPVVIAESIKDMQHMTTDEWQAVINCCDPKSLNDTAFQQAAIEQFEHYVHTLVNEACGADTLAAAQQAVKESVYQIKADDFATHIKNYLKAKLEGQAAAKQFAKCGLKYFDDSVGGLPKGSLIVTAARPSDGKTTFGLNLAKMAGLAGSRVGMVNIEEPTQDVFDKMICSDAKMDLITYQSEIYRGSAQAEQHLVRTYEKLYETYIVSIDIPRLTVSEMRERLSVFIQQHKLDIVIVDYLQIIKADYRSQSKVETIEDASQTCKELAKIYNIAFIALAQMNRDIESRGDFNPRFSDLKGSGSIEQDADVVLFLEPQVRDAARHDFDLKVHVGKFRNGPKGSFVMRWQKDISRVSEV
jgi:replicative DNA helicase